MKIQDSIKVLMIIVICHACHGNAQNESQISGIESELYQKMVLMHSNAVEHFNLADIRITTCEAREVDVESICNGESKLVFRFTDLNCSLCVKSIINSLIENSNRFGNQNIVLFISQRNQKFAKFIKLDYDVEFPIYVVPYRLSDRITEEYSIPYLFMLTPELTAQRVFFPEKSLPQMTNAYLQSLSGLINTKHINHE